MRESAPPPSCNIHITDDATLPPVSVIDDRVTGCVTLVIQRRQLHADPEGIMAEIGAHWNAAAKRFRPVVDLRAVS